MRYEEKPRTNCIYEKYCLLSSPCLLSGSKENPQDIKTQGIQIIEDTYHGVYFNKPFTNFDFSENNRKQQKTLGTPVSYLTKVKHQLGHI